MQALLNIILVLLNETGPFYTKARTVLVCNLKNGVVLKLRSVMMDRACVMCLTHFERCNVVQSLSKRLMLKHERRENMCHTP